MRLKSDGLAFNYTPAQETTMEKFSDLVQVYVTQFLSDFALVNYYKTEKRNYAFNDNGFQSITREMWFEMPLIDTNPRTFIYDAKDEMVYKVMEAPINPAYNPAMRKLIELRVELINWSDYKFDIDFIKDKYDELKGVLYASV